MFVVRQILAVMAEGSSSGELSRGARHAIYHDLLQRKTPDGFPYGTFSFVASKFGVCPNTVRRIWNRAKDAEGPENVAEAIESRSSRV